MNEYPLLSVTMPVYNVEQYVDKAIKSVLGQSYKNIELIIVDDGSTDNSGIICDTYISEPRVKVFHKKNGGLVSAREYALKYSKGDYVTFVDSDDWIEEHTFSEIIDFMINNNAEIGIYGYILDNGSNTKKKFKHHQDKIYTGEEAVEEMLKGRYFGWELADKVYKRTVINDVKVPTTIVCGEDLVRNYRVFPKCHRIGLHQMFSYHYVQRKNSITKAKMSKNFTLLPAVEYLMKTTEKEHLFVPYLFGIIEYLKLNAINDKLYTVEHEQKVLRKYMLHIFFSERFSFRQKIGAIILSLPTSLIRRVRIIR